MTVGHASPIPNAQLNYLVPNTFPVPPPSLAGSTYCTVQPCARRTKQKELNCSMQPPAAAVAAKPQPLTSSSPPPCPSPPPPPSSSAASGQDKTPALPRLASHQEARKSWWPFLACAMPRTAGPPFIASRANTVLSQSVSQSCAAGPVPSLVPSPPSLAGHARNLDRSERARGTRHVQQPPVTIGKLTAVLYRWVVICLWQVPRHAFGLYTMHVGGASWMHLGPPQHCSVFPRRPSHDLILQRRPKAPVARGWALLRLRSRTDCMGKVRRCIVPSLSSRPN